MPSFPETFADAAAVERYFEQRYGKSEKSRSATGDWLADYENDIKGDFSPKWATYSIEVLKRADKTLNGIAKATPDKILLEVSKSKRTGLSWSLPRHQPNLYDLGKGQPYGRCNVGNGCAVFVFTR